MCEAVVIEGENVIRKSMKKIKWSLVVLLSIVAAVSIGLYASRDTVVRQPMVGIVPVQSPNQAMETATSTNLEPITLSVSVSTVFEEYTTNK